jgi:serine/threonine-protein kinase
VAEEIIGGYRLLKHMVTGQTSQVWEVVESASNRHFAMKLLLPERARDPLHRKLIKHEATVGKQLAHPNIIKIVHVLKDPKNPGFVMEFFPAGSVHLRLLGKQFDYIREKAHTILKQAATALAFMNAKGWVHKDVKLDNILANGVGDVRLIDFALSERMVTGLAKLFRRKAKAAGTRSYMSPEQIRGLPLDARADIYSFGCSAYELVAGRPPFRGITSHDLLTKHITEKPASPCFHNPNVTEEFADLVLRMLQKKKEDRPRDFHEVLMQLRNLRVFSNEPQKTEV